MKHKKCQHSLVKIRNFDKSLIKSNQFSSIDDLFFFCIPNFILKLTLSKIFKLILLKINSFKNFTKYNSPLLLCHLTSSTSNHLIKRKMQCSSNDPIMKISQVQQFTVSSIHKSHYN